jgi:hypothetical protein
VEEVREYQWIVMAVYPRLGEVWALISQWIQMVFYNGWLYGHFVSNVFVFAVDKTIQSAV